MKGTRVKLWSSLSKSTKAEYKRKGVTPARYNAWQKLTPSQKSRQSRDAFLTAPKQPRRLPSVASSTVRSTSSTGTGASYTTSLTLTKGQIAAKAVHAIMDDGARYVSPHKVLQGVLAMRPHELTEAQNLPADEWRGRAATSIYPGYNTNPYHYR